MTPQKSPAGRHGHSAAAKTSSLPNAQHAPRGCAGIRRRGPPSKARPATRAGVFVIHRSSGDKGRRPARTCRNHKIRKPQRRASELGAVMALKTVGGSGIFSSTTDRPVEPKKKKKHQRPRRSILWGGAGRGGTPVLMRVTNPTDTGGPTRSTQNRLCRRCWRAARSTVI